MRINNSKLFYGARKKIFHKTSLKRTAFFLFFDVLLIALACFLGFLLRFDGNIKPEYFTMIKGFIALAVPLTIIFFVLERLYSISWSFISIREILKVGRAVILGFASLGAILFVLKENELFKGFPRSIVFISGALAFFFTASLRFAKRIYLHGLKNSWKKEKGKKNKVLIIGAGEAGEKLARHLIANSQTPYSLEGFIDDSPMKKGILIHGIKVLGTIEQLAEIIEQREIAEIIIAMPSAPIPTIRKTVELARQAKIKKIKILPGTKEILEEKVSLNNLREISIEDLLGREPVQIDTQAIKEYVTDKRILVTGAAGSIGSVLCEQILKFKPRQLIALDQRETALFYLKKKLNQAWKNSNFPENPLFFALADICDQNKIDHLFQKCQPDVVFHAAAYKHVPMMEDDPDEAVRNNILGTLNTGEASLKHKVKKFVMVSTDKAINPTSIMGASKRMAEKVCVWLNQKARSQKIPTRFCAVRFGNVLGSQGSVVPIFQRQIEKGGPVEVTDPEMKRYFMITAEACLLIMQAGAIGQDGEVFVLDMGQPVKILDLAKEMIRLAGYKPDIDIPIVFAGIRPGEKLFEEIITEKESPTKHEKIFISHLEKNGDDIQIILKEFEQALSEMNKEKIKGLLEIK
ncbi:polysaccharide biosynthesis protein [Patescibacteria group bacterium]|nr:polysaccharide biosynthesis protein [Patescibacteria group bacterium]